MTHLEREAVRYTKERLDAGEITHEEFNRAVRETVELWKQMDREDDR